MPSRQTSPEPASFIPRSRSRRPTSTPISIPTSRWRSALSPSDGLTILRNNGFGNFVEPASSPEPTGNGPRRAVAAADLDGDADLDLAVANSLSDDVTILRNR